MLLKICLGCHTNKPLHDFHRWAAGSDGLQRKCKSCDRARNAEKRKQEPLYVGWGGMIGRCCNPKYSKYENYGGRGISVCDEWRVFSNYKSAIEALGERPSPDHSIDRIDNDGNYCHGNIRWMDKSGQNINKRLSDKNKSGHKGVHFYKGAWDVAVKRGGHKYHVGRFNDLDEAVAARAKWIDTHFPS